MSKKKFIDIKNRKTDNELIQTNILIKGHHRGGLYFYIESAQNVVNCYDISEHCSEYWLMGELNQLNLLDPPASLFNAPFDDFMQDLTTVRGNQLLHGKLILENGDLVVYDNTIPSQRWVLSK